MRGKIESGNVVSSHSSAWGANSFLTNAVIDSRSCSCSSVKMKCLRLAPWSGLRTEDGAVDMGLLLCGDAAVALAGPPPARYRSDGQK